ncbi:conserved hypothetical protein [Ricinus communis]|uniref:Uncharacterized protein n=1 Tax=Ricinus communis TaxID=3988 RepID=B9SSL0_RICCO|nr:conserved hypothetical protein [Ricinus communis]
MDKQPSDVASSSWLDGLDVIRMFGSREDNEAPHANEEDTRAQVSPVVKLEEVAISLDEGNEN